MKAPSYVPPYYTENQVNQLIEAGKTKKPHKKLAIRDEASRAFKPEGS